MWVGSASRGGAILARRMHSLDLTGVKGLLSVEFTYECIGRGGTFWMIIGGPCSCRLVAGYWVGSFASAASISRHSRPHSCVSPQTSYAARRNDAQIPRVVSAPLPRWGQVASEVSAISPPIGTFRAFRLPDDEMYIAPTHGASPDDRDDEIYRGEKPTGCTFRRRPRRRDVYRPDPWRVIRP